MSTPPGQITANPISLALSDRHYGAVAVSLERANGNCKTADHRSSASPPPSAVYLNESVVEMQFKSHDSNTDIIGSNGQPATLPASHGWPLKPLNHGNSVPKSADSGSSI